MEDDILDPEEELAKAENRAQRRLEKLAKNQSIEVLAKQAQTRLEELDKERVKMIKRLVALVNQKSGQVHQSTRKKLKGTKMNAKGLIDFFVVGGCEGHVNELSITSGFQLNTGIFSVLKYKGAVMAVRCGKNALNPVFLIAKVFSDEGSECYSKLIEGLLTFGKAYQDVSPEMLYNYYTGNLK